MFLALEKTSATLTFGWCLFTFHLVIEWRPETVDHDVSNCNHFILNTTPWSNFVLIWVSNLMFFALLSVNNNCLVYLVGQYDHLINCCLEMNCLKSQCFQSSIFLWLVHIVRTRVIVWCYMVCRVWGWRHWGRHSGVPPQGPLHQESYCTGFHRSWPVVQRPQRWTETRTSKS